jgi:pSer/pThr/pTyr-binding forkhead associated (FHA) protein
MTAAFVLVLRIGLAVVLYYFLWQVLQTLRQDLKQQGNILSLQKKPGIYIDAITDTGREYKYYFWQTEILIGRSSHSAIILKDDSLSASHARISFHHAQWWLEDLGSTNGTILNEDRITTPTVVTSNDQFKCGNTTFTLRVDSFNNQSPNQLETDSRGEE